MKLSLLEICLLANAPKHAEKPNKSTLAMAAQKLLDDPNCEVRIVMPAIDNLVLKGLLNKSKSFTFTITYDGAKELDKAYKDLQELVWALPPLISSNS